MPLNTAHHLKSATHRYTQPTALFTAWVRDYLYFSNHHRMVMWNAKGRARKGVNVSPNTPAGTVTANGYRVIGIKGKQHPMTRIAWFLQTGVWPLSPVTTIDGTRTNYHIDNLCCDTIPLTPEQILRIDHVTRQQQRYTLAELSAMGAREASLYHVEPKRANLWPVFEYLKRIGAAVPDDALTAVMRFQLFS